MVQSRNIHNKIALSKLTKISRTLIKVGSQYCEAWEKIEQGWQDHYHIIQDVFVRHYFIGLIKKGCMHFNNFLMTSQWLIAQNAN